MLTHRFRIDYSPVAGLVQPSVAAVIDCQILQSGLAREPSVLYFAMKESGGYFLGFQWTMNDLPSRWRLAHPRQLNFLIHGLIYELVHSSKECYF